MSFKLSREDKIYERGRFGPMNNDCSFIIQRRKSYMGTGTYMCIAVVEIGNNSLLIVPVFWVNVRMKGRRWRFEGREETPVWCFSRRTKGSRLPDSCEPILGIKDLESKIISVHRWHDTCRKTLIITHTHLL